MSITASSIESLDDEIDVDSLLRRFIFANSPARLKRIATKKSIRTFFHFDLGYLLKKDKPSYLAHIARDGPQHDGDDGGIIKETDDTPRLISFESSDVSIALVLGSRKQSEKHACVIT